MKLFSWGANSYGQLGIGYTSEQCNFPTLVNVKDKFSTEDVKLIRGGGGHTFILLENGVVFVTGWNKMGQLGLGHREDVQSFTRLDFGFKIIDVALGWDFSLVLTDDNRILATGANSYSQLGVRCGSKFTTRFEEVHLREIVAIGAGLRHASAVDRNGTVFVWGDNKKGQLGPFPEKLVSTPVMLKLDFKAVIVACGQHFTVVLSETGCLYGFGDNKFGQLGSREDFGQSQSYFETNLSKSGRGDVVIKNVVAGWSHVCVLLGDGSVLIRGRNTYCQLGNSNFTQDSAFTFKSPSFEENVVQVCSGSEHVVALNTAGNLFCWGWNEHGNCGNGRTDNVSAPTQVLFPNKEKCKLIGNGVGCTFAFV